MYATYKIQSTPKIAVRTAATRNTGAGSLFPNTAVEIPFKIWFAESLNTLMKIVQKPFTSVIPAGITHEDAHNLE